MKRTTTVNLEVEMGKFENLGTSLSGYIEKASYEEIVKVFGNPQLYYKPGDKSQVEWIGKMNGEVFTIYDYKTEIPYRQNKEWNIGSRNKCLAERVKIYFELNK